jgi:hypothetical protein
LLDDPLVGALMIRSPPYRHCDTSTRTIRHCNYSPLKCLHIVTIRPHSGQTFQPPPNQFDPLDVGLNVDCDNPTHGQSDPWTIQPMDNPTYGQSNPWTIRPMNNLTHSLLHPAGGRQFGPRHIDGAVKKCYCATRENFTHAWVSWVQA